MKTETVEVATPAAAPVVPPPPSPPPTPTFTGDPLAVEEGL